MGGKISILLLAVSLWAVSPAWAQDSGSGQPDELQIIEFDYDHQNTPPVVNLPPTLQTPPAPPAPATSQAPVPVLAPADPPATKTVPAAKPAPAPPTKPAKTAKPASAPAPPTKPAKTAQPAKTAPPAAAQKQEKVITIIGEPEPPAAGAGAKPATSAPSDEELLDSLFGPMDQSPGGAAPADAKPPISAPITPAGQKTDPPKKVGPKTPAVSPLRPPISPAPSPVKVERSSDQPTIKVEKRSSDRQKVIVRTTRSPEGREVRFFHDEAAIVGDFNPRRRAVVDNKTRPKPPSAANYPVGWGLPTRADFRHWELATYYWSLVQAGHFKHLELATSRPIPIDKAGLPVGTPQPKNYW